MEYGDFFITILLVLFYSLTQTLTLTDIFILLDYYPTVESIILWGTVFAAQNIVGAGVLATQTELRHISLQGFCDEMDLLEEYATDNEYTLYVAPCPTQHVNGQEIVRLDFIKEGIVVRK